MRRLMRSALLAAAIVVTGCLATACAQSASGAIATASPSVTAPATATVPATPTPAPSTPAPTPATVSPSVVTSSATPTPATSSPASSGLSPSDLIWLWVVLGALILLGIILWTTHSPTRFPGRTPVGAASPATWRSRADDAYAQGGILDGAVRSAERAGAFADMSDTRWYDIRLGADNLTQTLYAMREAAPTEERRGQVTDALDALEAVRYAVDADVSIRGETPEQSADLHSRLLALQSSLNEMRAPEGFVQ
jgi:hypothetical protein